MKRRSPLAFVASASVAAAVLLACSTEPEVNVRTLVGSKAERSDPARAHEPWLRIVSTRFGPLLEQLAQNGRGSAHDETGGGANAKPVGSPHTLPELESLVRALRSDPVDELASPAHRIAHSHASLWPQVRRLLLAPRKHPKGDYRSVLHAIGGDVPNRYGYFDLHWKKAHGHVVAISEDWLADLLALPSSRVAKHLRSVYRDCVLESALLRACAAIGRDREYADDVVSALIEAAYVHEGTFRDEVGRAIRSVGDVTVPALVRLAKPPEGSTRPGGTADPAGLPAKKAAYARLQLDMMDRSQPERARAALTTQPRLLATLFASYGRVREPEAAATLLDHVDHPVRLLRDSSRAAFLAYVTGPVPQSVRKTVRLLGGGNVNTRAYLSYRQRASLAIRERLTRDAPELLEPPCVDVDPQGRRDPHCLAQSERMTRALLAKLDVDRSTQVRRAMQHAIAEVDEKRRIAALDRVLAEHEDLPSPGLAASVYEHAVEPAWSAGDTILAARLLRKAAMLHRAAAEVERAHALETLAARAEAESIPTLPHGRALLLGSVDDDSDVAPPSGWKRVRLGIPFHVLAAWLASAAVPILLGLLRRTHERTT